MDNISELERQARTLQRSDREKVLIEMQETHLHECLKQLFSPMDPDWHVEITHGISEHGKDLVIVKHDPLSVSVTAVVVKMGNVGAQTLGDVDEIVEDVEGILAAAPKQTKKELEIRSQIRQAKRVPAELPSYFARLAVDRVIVILGGKFSAQARTRLMNEVGASGQVYDIDWLVETFTKYYPQVFFDAQVCDFLQTQITKLEATTWRGECKRNLTEYFVEPMASSVAMPEQADIATLVEYVEQKRQPLTTALGLSQGTHRIILAGDPGTGKSAALAKMTIGALRVAHSRLLASKSPQNVRIPILVSARELLTVDNQYDLASMAWGELELLQRFAVSAIFVDGLDEVRPEDRTSLIEKANSLANQLMCSLVITTRKTGSAKAVPAGFRQVELMPFEVSQAIKMFEGLLRGDPRLTALKQAIDRVRDQIPIVPLSLLLLIDIVEEEKEVPSSITELYDRFIDAVLGRDDAKRGISVLFEYAVKKRFLAAVAYDEFKVKDRLSVPSDEFRKYADWYVSEYGLNSAAIEDFLGEIERAGLLRLGNEVEFSHRTFLDYFTALHIYSNADDFPDVQEALIADHFSGTWDGVPFFYVGLKKSVSQTLLERIFAYSAEAADAAFHKFFAGRLLQAGWHSTAATKEYGVKTAFALVPQMKDHLQQVNEARRCKAPLILADLQIHLMAGSVFQSRFLRDTLQEFLNHLIDNPSEENAAQMLPVLWVLKAYLEPVELDHEVKRCFDVLTMPGLLPVAQRAVGLTLLQAIEKKDRALLRSIQRQLDRLHRRYADVLKPVFPQARPGFRSKPKSKGQRRKHRRKRKGD